MISNSRNCRLKLQGAVLPHQGAALPLSRVRVHQETDYLIRLNHESIIYPRHTSSEKRNPPSNPSHCIDRARLGLYLDSTVEWRGKRGICSARSSGRSRARAGEGAVTGAAMPGGGSAAAAGSSGARAREERGGGAALLREKEEEEERSTRAKRTENMGLEDFERGPHDPTVGLTHCRYRERHCRTPQTVQN